MSPSESYDIPPFETGRAQSKEMSPGEFLWSMRAHLKQSNNRKI